jgi:hypothetical protein
MPRAAGQAAAVGLLHAWQCFRLLHADSLLSCSYCLVLSWSVSDLCLLLLCPAQTGRAILKHAFKGQVIRCTAW